MVVIPSRDEERKELPTFKWWEIRNPNNHPKQIYRKSMQKVVSAVGEEVEVSHNLLVLLLSKFQVRLWVAHLQHLEDGIKDDFMQICLRV